jgi:hypothetical protein
MILQDLKGFGVGELHRIVDLISVVRLLGILAVAKV